VKSKNAPLKLAALALISILSCSALRAQTLQLRYTFADGPGTTTTNDSASAVFPVVLNMKNATGVATDLHGGANSGVQNLGGSLNLNANNTVGNANGSWAVITNDANLGAGLGVVSDFTATIWFKMPVLFSNIANQGPRLWMIAPTGATDLNVANTIGLQFGSRSAASQAPTPLVDLNAFVGSVRVTPSIYYDFPTNVWLYCAMVYDSVGGNCYVYYGSEASPAKLYAVRPVVPGTSFDLSGGASLAVGNRISQARDFIGSITDFRFYKGVGSPAFVESVRQSATPLSISNLSPDGSVLLSGTNTLKFTASSANGVNTNNIKVSVNGVDVSTNLAFSGPATAVNVTYTNLPVNKSVLTQSIINGVTVSIKVTDDSGVVTTNSYVYDGFDPKNFSFEAEDFDFGGGLFIDNPVVSFVGPDTNTYYNEQTPYVSLVDANDNGNASGPSRIYRDPSYPVETEFSIGTGNNGGNSIGELMRQKVIDAFAITPIANEVNVGYFDGGTGAGLPNWMNYTRTYSNGNYNVYLRAADGGGNISAALDLITGGWGTDSQTTTNLGTFSMANSGGWDTFSWVPLRDASGNLVRVQLNGTNTLRLTAGAAGGGNVNFLMLTPANTNLPTITGIYPNGTNMFQPSPTFSFVAAGSSGIGISTNAIKVRLTVTNLLGQGFVTNLTATNGLSFSGTSTSWTVTTPLNSNSLYSATINVSDINGTAVGTTVTFDTLSPSYTWEAPDYDHDGGIFVADPIPVNGYQSVSGANQIDFNYPNALTQGNTYRDSFIVGVENNGDFPQRLQYLTNNPAPQPYDIGFFNGGDWLNYTRSYPAGIYNMYVRAADGSTGGALGNVGISVVTGGWGGSPQTTTNLGTFNIPVTGGWQTYTWVPLRDSTGNLVKFNGGNTTNTLRATSAGSQNVFFFALFPANTNLPILSGLAPLSGSNLTNTFSFLVQSTAGVASNNVVVTVNGTTVSNLVFTGTINNWTVSYPHLAPNRAYQIAVTVTDVNGNTSTTSASFDTLNPANYTWEAEDFDHDGGLFFDNPQTNAYAGLGAVIGADAVQINFNASGAYTYRSSGSFTAVNGDVLRPQYQDVNNPLSDYEIGFFSDGAWANYTRNFPAGTYNIFGRFATASAAGSDALLAQVTSGWGTLEQSSNVLGSFTIPNTGGWESYAFVPLRDSSGNLVTVTFNGSTNTLQLIRPLDTPASADANVNFLMLAPVFATTAAQVSTNVAITFPTVTGFNYQVQYKTNLTDPAWLPLGSPLPGNGSNRSVSDPDNTRISRFYRVQIQ
jgi:hypothetical protein